MTHVGCAISPIRSPMYSMFRCAILPLTAIALVMAGYFYSLSNHPSPTLAISAVIAMCLLMASVFFRREQRKRGWRLTGKGRDELRYEELVDGRWTGFDIYAELLHGRPSRVLGIWDEKIWTIKAPDWAKNRRDEIIARIGKEAEKRGYATEEVAV